MTTERTVKQRWLLLAAKAAILALVVWGVHHTAAASWSEFRQQWAAGHWRLRPAWLAAAGALYLLSVLPCGWFWRRVLAALGQPAGLYRILRAYYVGHLGKYVPGKAMVVVVRTAMARRAGGDTPLVAVSVFYETLTSMAVGAATAAAILAGVLYHNRLLLLLSLGVLLAAGLPTFPPLFRRLLAVLRVARLESAASANVERLGYRTLALGWLAIGAGWWLAGLSLWATLAAVGANGAGLASWPFYTAAAALATVAGFVSFLPGGLVVREAVLLEVLVLVPGVSPAQALAAAVLLRLSWLVAELAISAILYPCSQQ